MTLFGLKLSKIENRLLDNVKKTKSVFPEETRMMESGFVLMLDLTQVPQDAVNDFKKKPNLLTNYNLFARNIQLLLNAYFCLLSSSYGTQFVILRTVLENSYLMRYFNKNPQHAYEWLPRERQKMFSEETQLTYGKSGKENEEFKPSPVRSEIFATKEKVRKDVEKFYDQLCNYTHPNFLGWQELIGRKELYEIIQNVPQFSPDYADYATPMMLYLMQLSFKEFFETFKGHLSSFAPQLEEWQENFKRLMMKYEVKEP
jgi:hypothetical protein